MFPSKNCVTLRQAIVRPKNLMRRSSISTSSFCTSIASHEVWSKTLEAVLLIRWHIKSCFLIHSTSKLGPKWTLIKPGISSRFKKRSSTWANIRLFSYLTSLTWNYNSLKIQPTIRRSLSRSALNKTSTRLSFIRRLLDPQMKKIVITKSMTSL